jgi:hypothetical protein
MEFYKLPAGRLATIFYKTEPKVIAKASATSSDISDGEKGGNNEDVPPESSPRVLAAHDPLHSVSTHNGRTLAWQDITLELKVGGEVKRLLDGLSGKSAGTAQASRRLFSVAVYVLACQCLTPAM